MSVAGGTVAVVLAGGEARRMGGGDKALLTIAGRPMIASIIAALDPLPVAISANGDPARFRRFACPVLGDGSFVGEGPLAGLFAGLTWAASLQADALLTVPGDTPFIPRQLAETLAPAPACAATGGRSHNLVALWPVSCRAALGTFLSCPGGRAVGAFARLIDMRAVDFPTEPYDHFLNVNTPKELAMAQSCAGDRRSPETQA